MNCLSIVEIQTSEGKTNLVAIRKNELLSDLVYVNMVDIKERKVGKVGLAFQRVAEAKIMTQELYKRC